MASKKSKPNSFYVYVLFRPNGIPFYVGKGTGERWKWHFYVGKKHYNPHLARIIKKSGGEIPVVFLREGITSEEAIKIEIAFIAAIGRKKNGGPLVNLTDGGEGVKGASRSEETKEKIRIKAIQRYLDRPELKENISKLRKGIPLSGVSLEKAMETVKNLQSQENTAKRNEAMIAVRSSEEYKEKQSIDSKKRWECPVFREMMSNIHKNHRHSSETKKKIGDKQRGIPCPSRGRKKNDK